ncbi:MAG TPA: hypothetical protein VL172_00785, partial [Kofleriaceae bacterium]|nr:hypothetical protein [Kofleriaceae bacterium]
RAIPRRRGRRRPPAAEQKKILAQAARELELAIPGIFGAAAIDTLERLKLRRRRGTYFEAKDQLQLHMVAAAVRFVGGDRRLAAKLLGSSLSTVKAYARAFGLARQ